MRLLIKKPVAIAFRFPFDGIIQKFKLILCTVNILQKQIIRKSILFATFLVYNRKIYMDSLLIVRLIERNRDRPLFQWFSFYCFS